MWGHGHAPFLDCLLTSVYLLADTHVFSFMYIMLVTSQTELQIKSSKNQCACGCKKKLYIGVLLG